MEELKRIRQRCPGTTAVFLDLTELGRRRRVAEEFWVVPGQDLRNVLEMKLGKENVTFVM